MPTVAQKGRFGGGEIVGVAVCAIIVILAVGFVLVAKSNLFDATTTATVNVPVRGGDSAVEPATDSPTTVVEGTVTTSSTELAPATFAITALVLIGSIFVVLGFGLGAAEINDLEATEPGTGGSEVRLEAEVTTGTGAAALTLALGKLASALGDALKGLKASSALVLMGGLMILTGGLVAWQTIPGTNRNPTIELTDEDPEGETTTTTAGGGDESTTTSDAPTTTSAPPTTTADP